MVKNRIIKYDIIRTFAIICVILCHSTEFIYSFDYNSINALPIASKLFCIITFTIGRIGVPLFLFLSGALLLKKAIDDDTSVLKFYKKNLIPLIIANFLWVIIYNIFFYLTNQNIPITIKDIIDEMLFLKKIPSIQMWYFPMIIGIYLGIPFIAKIVKSFSFKSLFPIISLILISNFILPTINILFNIFKIHNSLNSLLSISFLGGQYGLYIILGYYISKNKNDINNLIIYTAALFNFLVMILVQLLSFSNISNSVYKVWYNDIFLLLCSTCIFILFNKINDSKINNLLKRTTNYVTK